MMKKKMKLQEVKEKTYQLEGLVILIEKPSCRLISQCQVMVEAEHYQFVLHNLMNTLLFITVGGLFLWSQQKYTDFHRMSDIYANLVSMGKRRIRKRQRKKSILELLKVRGRGLSECLRVFECKSVKEEKV